MKEIDDENHVSRLHGSIFKNGSEPFVTDGHNGFRAYFYRCGHYFQYSIRSSILQCRALLKRSNVTAAALLMSLCLCSKSCI